MLTLLVLSACRSVEVVDAPGHPSLAGCTWEEWEYDAGSGVADLYTRLDYDGGERLVRWDYVDHSYTGRVDYAWEGECLTGLTWERADTDGRTLVTRAGILCDAAGWSTSEAYFTVVTGEDGVVTAFSDNTRDYENTFGEGDEIATRRYDVQADGSWETSWAYTWKEGRVVAREEHAADGEWSGTETWFYDEAGEIALYEDNYAEGHFILEETTRDELGRVRTVARYGENAYIDESFTNFLYEGDDLYPYGWERDEGYRGIDGETDYRAEIRVACP